MNVLSLFSGIGGLDLGCEAAGMRVVAMCEADPACRAFLGDRWPGVPVFEDVVRLSMAVCPPRSLRKRLRRGERIGFVESIRATLATLPGPVDVVVGGFPCQDVSVAGKREGMDGARTGLWKHMRRVIAGLRPSGLIAENVPGIGLYGTDRVCGDLERNGYAVRTVDLAAEDVGAPHRRHRRFFIGVADGCGPRLERVKPGLPMECARLRGRTGMADAERYDGWSCEQGRRSQVGALACGPGAGVADAKDDDGWCRKFKAETRAWSDDFRRWGLTGCGGLFPPRPSDAAGWSEILKRDAGLAPATEQHVCGVADGLPPRVVSRHRRWALKSLGNAVVPQVAEVIARGLMGAMREMEVA